MTEPVFKSSLSEVEILRNFQNTDLFSGIAEALRETIAFEKGKVDPAVMVREFSLSEKNMRKS